MSSNDILFRCYDHRLKKFSYFDLLNTHGRIPSDCSENIQRSSGIYDVEGKLIYEGDIVYLLNPSNPKEREQNNFQIIFESGAFQLKPIKLRMPTPSDRSGGNTWFNYLILITGHDDDGDPIYEYEAPCPQPIKNYCNIICVIGNTFDVSGRAFSGDKEP